MQKTSEAKITAKGQITVPSAVRAALGVGPGDHLIFTITSNGRVEVRPRKRCSILEIAEAHPIRSEGKVDLDALIGDAVGAAMAEREHRSRRGPRR